MSEVRIKESGIRIMNAELNERWCIYELLRHCHPDKSRVKSSIWNPKSSNVYNIEALIYSIL